MQIELNTVINSEDLIGQMVCGHSDHQEIVEFIKRLDEECQDWDVTEALYEHFADLHKKYLEETKDET